MRIKGAVEKKVTNLISMFSKNDENELVELRYLKL